MCNEEKEGNVNDVELFAEQELFPKQPDDGEEEQ